MTWAVTAATVANIGGSLLGGASARKQAEAKRRALEEAKGQVTQAYQTSKGYYDPYYQTGTAASNRLAALLGVGGDTSAKDYGYLTQEFTPDKMQYDPSYLFRLNEALKATNSLAANRGGLLSGATIRGAQKRASDLASTEYANAYDRYRQRQQDIYGMLRQQQQTGYQAGGDLANLSTGYGANMANFAQTGGAIDAAKTASQYKMYGDILSAGSNALGSYFGGKMPSAGGGSAGGGSTYGGYGSYDLNNPFSTSWGK